jgi:hypothetical protein
MRISTTAAVLLASVLASEAAIADPVASAPQSKPVEKVTTVIKQPFSDLNLVKPKIAPVLVRAKQAPYARPSGDCQVLNTEIEQLDLVLGPDVDASVQKASLSKKMTDGGFNLARGAASSVIPYRGIVRQVTGAEKRSHDANDALLAGMVRRAYLKGYGEVLGCGRNAED